VSRKLLFGLVAGGGVVAIATVAIIAGKSGGSVTVPDAMVRVTTASGTGAGF